MQNIGKVSVLGCGLMGCAIAQNFAGKGFKVITYDNNPNAVPIARISENCDFLIAKGEMSEEQKEQILENVSFCQSLKEAVQNSDFIIESVFENLEIKRNLLKEAEKYCREDAVLTSNTSVISITDIAQALQHKNRFVGTHFWNPAHLIPLVEVIKSDYTDDKTMDTAYELLKSIGKKPVRCNKDVPGFIGNRLQVAIWREAVYLIEQGVADAATIDETVKNGFGLRLAQTGPMENMDLIGLDLVANIKNYVLPHLCDSHEPAKLLLEKISDGQMGFKSGGKGFQTWTDEQMKQSREGLSDYLVDIRKLLNK